MDIGNFIPELSVTGVLLSAAILICDGNDLFCHSVKPGENRSRAVRH
jgi:hypothetical protein